MFTAIFSGNLGADPTYDSTKDGTPRARCRVAVSMGKDKPAVWYNVTLFGKAAQTFAERVPLKGTRVQVRCLRPITARVYAQRTGEYQASADVDADWIEVAPAGGQTD